MVKFALIAAFVMSLVPATCAKKSPEPTFQPISAPIYVEPAATKGKY